MMTVDKNKHIPNPAFALEQEIIREEVQEGLQVAVEQLDEKTEKNGISAWAYGGRSLVHGEGQPAA